MNDEACLEEYKPSIKLRIKELVLDWLVISGYLVVLFAFFMIFYLIVLEGIPEFSHLQSQLVSMFTTVLPISLMFSIKEGSVPYGSWGKTLTGLTVSFTLSPRRSSLVRNILKFLPWQFGHMSTIYGIYYGFESPFALICLMFSIGLAFIYIVMAFTRKDGRHLADMIAGSRVIYKK